MGAGAVVMSIDDALHGTTRLFIDTAPLIYLIERHPVYFPVVQEVARRIDGGRWLHAVRLSP